MLAAATYGNGYSQVATPSSVAYGLPWQGPQNHSSSSPSIWSHQYNGNAQWPSSSHNRHPSMGGYGMQAYVQQPQPPVSQLMASQAQQVPPQQRSYGTVNSVSVPVHLVQGYDGLAPAPMLSYSAQPVMLVPQNAPPMQAQQQPMMPQQQHSRFQVPYQQLVQAPRLMPHYIHPVQPQMPMFHQRMPPYQAVPDTPPNPVPTTEYDLHAFAKFLLSVCFGIVEETMTPEETSSFEGFIETVLCATRLQLSTLYMSLVFLNRSNKLCDPAFKRLPLKKRLVCALILANKMHDDNTFTNASWSIVSTIPTKEITSLEAACLKAFDWDLSLGESGVSEWQYWEKCWHEFEQKVQMPSPVSPAVSNDQWNAQLSGDTFTIAAAC